MDTETIAGEEREVVWRSKCGNVVVVRSHDIEVGTATPRNPRPGYRWVAGYAIVVDGRVSMPMRRRDVMAAAKERAADMAIVARLAPLDGGGASVRKPYNDRAGYRCSKRSGIARGWVVVYRAVDQGIDVGGCPWATVCETHGEIVGTTSERLARDAMKTPAGWCSGCRGES